MIEIKRWVSTGELNSLREDVNNKEVINIGDQQFQYVGYSYNLYNYYDEFVEITLQLTPYTNPEAFPNPLPDHFLLWPGGGKEFEHEVKKFADGEWYSRYTGHYNDWVTFDISSIVKYKDSWKYKGVPKIINLHTQELIKQHEESIKLQTLNIEHYERMIDQAENIILYQREAINNLKGNA